MGGVDRMGEFTGATGLAGNPLHVGDEIYFRKAGGPAGRVLPRLGKIIKLSGDDKSLPNWYGPYGISYHFGTCRFRARQYEEEDYGTLVLRSWADAHGIRVPTPRRDEKPRYRRHPRISL